MLRTISPEAAMDKDFSEFANVFKLSPEKAETRSKTGRKAYKLILAKDITAASTAKTYLIDGFLGRDEVSIWYGAPECGKSTAKIDAACHVAAGLPWCGRAITQGPVLYVAAERGQLVLRRVLAWRLHHGIDDFPLAVINDAVDLRTGRVDADRVIEAAKVLEKQYSQPAVWVIFDTLSRILAGGDENSSKDMGLLVLSVDHVKRETGAHPHLCITSRLEAPIGCEVMASCSAPPTSR
jgi:RecA-family ATPase